MLIYIILAALTIFLFLFSKKKERDGILYYFMLSAIWFLGATRSMGVGTDTYEYFLNFKRTTFNPNTWNYNVNFEIGFNYLVAFFRTFVSTDYALFIAFTYTLFVLVLNKTIKRNTTNTLLAFFFFITLGYLGCSFNIFRQILAMSFIYCFLPYIENRKIIFYVIIVILTAIFVHITMLILLLFVMYPLLSKYLNKKIMAIIVSTTFILALLQFNIQSSIVDMLALIPVLAGSKFDGYMGREADFSYSVLSYSFHTLFFLLTLYVIPSAKNIYLYAFALGLIFLNLLGNINPVFARTADLFLFGRIFLFSDLWFSIEKKWKRYVFRWAVLFYTFYLLINSLLKNYGEIVPYINTLFE